MGLGLDLDLDLDLDWSGRDWTVDFGLLSSVVFQFSRCRCCCASLSLSAWLMRSVQMGHSHEMNDHATNWELASCSGIVRKTDDTLSLNNNIFTKKSVNASEPITERTGSTFVLSLFGVLPSSIHPWQ